MNVQQAMARCWAEIDLDKLLDNYRNAQSEIVNGARIIPVLKANAYGMGALPVARALASAGASLFAVAAFREAMELKAGLKADVLVMGMTGDAELWEAVDNGVIVTLFGVHQARLLSEAAQKLQKPARVHLKIDTGLHRLGFAPDEAVGQIQEIARMRGIQIEGMYSHLALRNEEEDARQFERLTSVQRALEEKGISVGMMHLDDSIGMVRHPEYQLDAVRIAAYLFGVTPYRYAHPEKVNAICTLKARIADIHWVEAGECVGYDEDHPLKRKSRVATLCAGYVDGFPRVAEVGSVEILGRRAPVVGLVCMDQMMVDVTDIPEAAPGGEAILLGSSIKVDELASWAHLNRNEAYARINRRVPRIYRQAGKADFVVDYMTETGR